MAGDEEIVRDQAARSSRGVDQILDVQHIDRIDLSAIDANTSAAGNQAFAFIGNEAFSGAGPASAGQLRAFQSGANWMVEGDTNGDGIADLVILVTLFDPGPIGAGDFIL